MSAGIFSDAYFSNRILRFSADIKLSHPTHMVGKGQGLFFISEKGQGALLTPNKGQDTVWLLRKSREHFWLLKIGQGVALCKKRKTWTLVQSHYNTKQHLTHKELKQMSNPTNQTSLETIPNSYNYDQWHIWGHIMNLAMS